MKKLNESEVHSNVTGPAVVGTGDDTTGMTWGKKRKRKSFRDFLIFKRKELEDIAGVNRNRIK